MDLGYQEFTVGPDKRKVTAPIVVEPSTSVPTLMDDVEYPTTYALRFSVRDSEPGGQNEELGKLVCGEGGSRTAAISTEPDLTPEGLTRLYEFSGLPAEINTTVA